MATTSMLRPPHDGTITKAVSISALVISLPIIYVSLLRVPPSTLARDTTFWFLMSNSIIAIIAADSGMPFFGTAADSHHDDVPADEQPAVATQQISYEDATWVMALRPDEPTMAGISHVVMGNEEVVRKDGAVTSNDVVLALMEDDGAASKPCSARMGHAHAPVQQGCEEQEEEASVEVEPISINKNCSSMMVKGDFASKEIVKGDEWPILLHPPTTTIADDHAPKDELGFAEVPMEETKPARCSVAEETSKAPPPDEREYWQLSDEELNRKVEEFITRFNRDMVEQEAHESERSSYG